MEYIIQLSFTHKKDEHKHMVARDAYTAILDCLSQLNPMEKDYIKGAKIVYANEEREYIE